VKVAVAWLEVTLYREVSEPPVAGKANTGVEQAVAAATSDEPWLKRGPEKIRQVGE